MSSSSHSIRQRGSISGPSGGIDIKSQQQRRGSTNVNLLPQRSAPVDIVRSVKTPKAMPPKMGRGYGFGS
jgi:hypothetical protein